MAASGRAPTRITLSEAASSRDIRQRSCGNKCQLSVGYVASTNGGTSCTAATELAGPMSLTWRPSTTQGRMVGDYISTSYVGGTARPVFAVASQPSGTAFAQLSYTPTGGLFSGAAVVTAGGEQPVPGAASDYAAPQAPIVRR